MMMSGWSLLEVALYALAALALGPVGVLVHELGHAVVARRFGAEVVELVAAGEGPALSLVVAGVRVRCGLALGRELRSQEPEGWVSVGLDRLTTLQAIAALRAGPIAEAVYGAVAAVVVVAVGMPAVPTVLLLLGTLGTVVSALANLRADGPPETDGARIAALRERLVLEKLGLVPRDAQGAFASAPSRKPTTSRS
jgi:membrane-associated protease RseP (regulator of RpoE activity)